MPVLRIGTRGSPLALWQARAVGAALAAATPALASPDAIAIEAIRTTGDRVQDRTLAAIGGKGLFTKEIDEALLAGAIDLAVHSMKDVPTVLPDGLVIDGHLPRADARDALIARDGGGLDDLPAGAVVGTASLRRQAQLLHRRPDLRVVPLRGNVETRLAKIAAGEADGTLLAIAGLLRLGRQDAASEVLSMDVMLPAVAQGAIGVARRAADDRMAALLALIDHGPTATAIAAERSMLAVLDGSCRTPIAGHAAPQADGRLALRGLVASVDGRAVAAAARSGAPADAVRLGADLGAELLAHGAGTAR